MPFASINEADIYYEVIGDRGPWVVAMSGGRHPLSEIEELTTAIAARGFRVIVHDRRNCGRSSLHFDASRSEEDLWADDLHGLLDRLRVRSAFVVGKSRTVRVAIRFAMRYPHQTRGLGLWGISGGAQLPGFSRTTTTGSTSACVRNKGWTPCADLTTLRASSRRSRRTETAYSQSIPQVFSQR